MASGGELLGEDDMMRPPKQTGGFMRYAKEGAGGAERVRIVTKIRRPKAMDPRTTSDMNWEGKKALRHLEKLRGAPELEPFDDDEGRRAGQLVRIGPFYTYGPLPEKQQGMIRNLLPHFDEPSLRELALMISESEIPLRMYDWVVTNFTKEKQVAREVFDADGTSTIVDIHSAYKNDRWSVRKRHWDFFCKRIKIAFDVDGKTYVTAVTQLNSFLFAKRLRLKEFIQEHHDEIQTHYQDRTKDRKRVAAEAVQQQSSRPKRRRRKELSQGAQNPVFLSEVSVVTRLSLQDE